MGKILVLDDENDILEILLEILEEDGHNVTTFNNPKEAIQHLTENTYDLIVSDIKMPCMSGVEFLKELKTFNHLPFKKFVFITGFAELSKEEALNMGANNFFSKPLDIENFLISISELVKSE